MVSDRILCPKLANRVMSSSEAASLIESGMTIGMSGFSTGAPKEIPLEMVKSGTRKNLTILQGAGLGMGDSMIDAVARSGAVSRYAAFQWNAELRKKINIYY